MNINDIPLQRLKEILASDMPLTIVTTEALIARLEQAEAAVARVRGLCTELRDKPVRQEAPDYVRHVLAGVSNAAADILEALRGEPHE